MVKNGYKTWEAPQINGIKDLINCMPAFLTHDMCQSAFATFFTSISSIFAKLLKASLTNEKNPSHKLKRVTIKLKIAFGIQIDILLYKNEN